MGGFSPVTSEEAEAVAPVRKNNVFFDVIDQVEAEHVALNSLIITLISNAIPVGDFILAKDSRHNVMIAPNESRIHVSNSCSCSRM
jgi:hypothetical protein